MSGRRPIVDGLRLVRGSLRLILMRGSLVALAALPALFGAAAGLARSAGRQPYFTEVSGPLPLIHLVRLQEAIGSTVVALAILAVLLALLGQQVLVAGALAWLDPDRDPPDRALRAVLARGASHLWPMIRVVLVAALLAALGSLAIDRLFDVIALRGDRAHWSGQAMNITLPLAQLAVTTMWLSVVGAGAFWCRVILVADRRKLVRTAGLLVLRVWRRHPLRGPAFHAAITLCAAAAGGAFLAAWRQAPPDSLFRVGLACVTWLEIVFVQAIAWHWILRSSRLLYAAPTNGDLRRHPDRPWGVAEIILRALRRRQGPGPIR